MDRTRVIFFAVLAISLLVAGASLALQWVSDQTALQFFVAATVFSAGVIVMDFLGVLGGHVSGDAAGHLGDGSSGGEALHMDGGHFDVSHGSTDTGASDLATGHDGGHLEAGDGGAHDGDAHGVAGQHPNTGTGATPIISVLAYLRLMVYFCLGFGPTGWLGMATGRGALGSLAIATPVGILALLVAQAFFRFQRHDTDSQITRQDLLTAEATVTIPLDHKTMGKVRVRVGMGVVDRYALAADAEASFVKGARVRIVALTDDCVYVR